MQRAHDRQDTRERHQHTDEARLVAVTPGTLLAVFTTEPRRRKNGVAVGIGMPREVPRFESGADTTGEQMLDVDDREERVVVGDHPVQEERDRGSGHEHADDPQRQEPALRAQEHEQRAGHGTQPGRRAEVLDRPQAIGPRAPSACPPAMRTKAEVVATR